MIDTTQDRATDAEYSLIGALCIEEKVMDNIRDKVTADDFTVSHCAFLFDAAEETLSRGKKWDAVIASAELAPRIGEAAAKEFILECMEICPTVHNAEEHARLIHKHAESRRLKESITDAINNAADAQDLAATLSGICTDFTRQNNARGLKKLSTVISDTYKGLMTPSPEEHRFDTGFPLFDAILDGFWSTDLVIIAARPGVGKSSFACSEIGISAARAGNTGIIYTYEMEDKQVVKRMIAKQGRIALKSIKNKKLEDSVQILGTACAALSKLPLFINDDPYTTLADIRSQARQIKDLRFIVVDYLTLMPAHVTRDRYDLAIGELTRGLKLLAKELKITVIVLSQLNRRYDDTQEPTLTALRQSGDVEQDADQVIFLWWADKEDKTVGCSVAKNRNGETGKTYFTFDGDYMRYYERNDYHPPARKRNEVYDDD